MAKEDTYSYKGWLTSDKFLKRCFGTLGYYMMSVLIIWAGLFVVFSLIGLAVMILGKIF